MRAAFTLVEMLVVITIIGILAALTVPAVMRAIRTAKIAAVALEVKQLEMACQTYKEKFGEYPPDFTDAAAVTRHLAKAFPRYQGIWQNDLSLVTGGAPLTPQTALAIWLGGIPDPNNGGRLSGFAADATNPFQLPTLDLSRPTIPVCPGRIGPFFDFDPARLNGYRYWPQKAVGNGTTGAIVYFRAENGNYTGKSVTDAGDGSATVYPAVDTRVGNTWLNQSSVQIFSSGLDLRFGTPTSSPLLYPAGTNYNDGTGFIYDNITNFSDGGTLEDKIP